MDITQKSEEKSSMVDNCMKWNQTWISWAKDGGTYTNVDHNGKMEEWFCCMGEFDSRR